MIHKNKLLTLVLLLVLLVSSSASAIGIFVWQHDNNLTSYDPVLRITTTVTNSVTRTLDQLGMRYTLGRELPEDLDRYDVVITCLSFFCEGG